MAAWNNSITKEALALLQKRDAPFKLVGTSRLSAGTGVRVRPPTWSPLVHCAILQNDRGAGYYASSSCYWEDASDGRCSPARLAAVALRPS